MTATFRILSLPKDTGRRQLLDERLRRQGHAADYVMGLGPSEVPLALQAHGIGSVHPSMSPAEVSCALGHLEIYRRHPGAAPVLVLEDDAIPLARPGEGPEVVAARLQPDEVLILGVSIKREHLAGRPAPHVHPEAVELDLFSIFMLRGAVAYAVPGEVRRRIAEAQARELRVADGWWHFHRCGAVRRFYFLEYFRHPPVTLQTSNIEAGRAGRAGPLGRRLVRAAAKSAALASVGAWRRLLRAREPATQPGTDAAC